MTAAQTRLALVILLTAALIFGGVVTWSATHHHEGCYVGAIYYKHCP